MKKDEDVIADEIRQELQDHDAWAALDPDAQLTLLANGLALYGATCEEDLIASLVPLYSTVRDLTPAADRARVLSAIRSAIDDVGLSCNALLPFILLDDDVGIVSTAALDLAMYQPGGPDGLEGVRRIIGHIERGEVQDRGAAFGGLLLLGDARVCALLRPPRVALEADEVKTAVLRCSSGFVYEAVIDFYLDWLDSLPGDESDARYAHVASALHLMPERMNPRKVVSVKREFGETDPRKRVRLLGEWSLSEMGKRMEPRLVALEAREPPPKISSAILRAWGLSPRAPRGEQAIGDH